jgi:predicted nucleic acid-binding protein
VILVDTSVWIDHLRSDDAGLKEHLQAGRVLSHPFVIGELALGNLLGRQVILVALQDLPQANTATDAEVMRFIASHQLYGLGIGYVDAHLLAAVRLTPGASLWTRDKRLREVASRLGVAGSRPH